MLGAGNPAAGQVSYLAGRSGAENLTCHPTKTHVDDP